MLFRVIILCNGLKMSEYDVYWLINFPLINSLALQERIILYLYALVIKQTKMYKEN